MHTPGLGAVGASSGSESRHTSECGSGGEGSCNDSGGDDAGSFADALRGLGSIGGALTQADLAEVDRLLGSDSRASATACSPAAGERRVAFKCNMLIGNLHDKVQSMLRVVLNQFNLVS